MTRDEWRTAGWTIVLSLSLGTLACEEEKKPTPTSKAMEEKVEEPEPEAKSPPHFVIGEDAVSVRGMSLKGSKKTGTLAEPDVYALTQALTAEKEFIDGQTLRVIVDRKAMRGWVGTYLTELGKLGASQLTVVTETRTEFPGQLTFLPPKAGSQLAPCTMIGQVTEHNGSALWQLKGGTAKARGPGLGGPDLSMAQEVFTENYKNCESSTFVTDGDNAKEWGFIYDMAAAAVSTKEAGIKQALLPSSPQTAGRPAEL